MDVNLFRSTNFHTSPPPLHSVYFVFGRRTEDGINIENMELPGKERCTVDQRKVTDYLLNNSRMPAAAKARFFFSCGFTLDSWKNFAEALKVHGQTQVVTGMTESAYGTKYEIEGPLPSPDGRSPEIRTVWQIDTDELAPRLITAYPILK